MTLTHKFGMQKKTASVVRCFVDRLVFQSVSTFCMRAVNLVASFSCWFFATSQMFCTVLRIKKEGCDPVTQCCERIPHNNTMTVIQQSCGHHVLCTFAVCHCSSAFATSFLSVGHMHKLELIPFTTPTANPTKFSLQPGAMQASGLTRFVQTCRRC